MVEVPEVPCGSESEAGDALIEKSALLGLKTMLSTGWISMPFGATPVWPWRKSNIPTPVICTGMLAVWKLVVAVKRASNTLRELVIPGPNGLPAPTQFGDGISAIIVLPEASLITRW